ncbi:MAG: ParB/RepB/Spo0J family partition protein [Legionellales bacterium]|nr:ParB/RepB/Spo0J family partition protein [Legionellales bacterium]
MHKKNPLLKKISIEKLVRSKFQPRTHFCEEAIEELAKSIKQNGILQPIVVRPTVEDSTYEIIAGERRWRAAQKIGLSKIDCLINSYTDQQAAAAAAIENLNRADLNPIEEAYAYQRLIQQFDISHEEVAATMGKSRTKITNSLRLLSLDKKVTEMIIEGLISESHGKIIAGVEKRQQFKIASKCITKNLSVRQLENLTKKVPINKKSSCKNIEITSLENKLSEYIGSPTEITYNDGQGNIKIFFQNLDILDGILEKIKFIDT